MERLTERWGEGDVWVKEHDYVSAAYRLADYEDAEEGLNKHGYSIERLVELLKADKEGRVAVLPCKDWLDIVFGEQILFWGIDAGYPENPVMEISVDNTDRIGWYDGWKTVFLKGTDDNGQAWEFSLDAIGKTVFLSREEAEKALRRPQ